MSLRLAPLWFLRLAWSLFRQSVLLLYRQASSSLQPLEVLLFPQLAELLFPRRGLLLCLRPALSGLQVSSSRPPELLLFP